MAKMRKIPSDTDYFHFHNENPDGQRTGDCVVRAIARATGKTWDEVYDDLVTLGREMRRMPNSKDVYYKYLERLGWVRKKQPRWNDGKKVRAHDFIDNAHHAKMPIIFNETHHLTCIVDGKINDIWDGSECIVGVYWVRDGWEFDPEDDTRGWY